jgi:hypothetical protein
MSKPSEWTEYKNINIIGQAEGNKLKEYMQKEEELKKKREEIRKELFKGKAVTKQDWLEAMRFCNMKPYQEKTIIIDKEGRIILDTETMINTQREYLEEATETEYISTRPKRLELTYEKTEDVVDMMVEAWGRVGKNTACGIDGVHPIIQQLFDIKNKDREIALKDKQQVIKIIRDSLN